MIVEQRTYTLEIGGASNNLALCEAEGLTVQREILRRLVGYFSSDIGALHQIATCGPTKTTLSAKSVAPFLEKIRAGWSIFPKSESFRSHRKAKS